jgi:hypothetical protein
MAGQEQNRGSYEPTFVEDGIASRKIDMAASTAGAGTDIPHVEIPDGSDEIGIMGSGGGMNEQDFHEGIAGILRGQARSRSPYTSIDTINRLHGVPNAPRTNRSATDSGITRI